MLEMVEARRDADKVGERHDLFSGLLDAAQVEQDCKAMLSDEELIGGHLYLRSFAFSEKRPSRKHVYLSSCWT